jgi:hypothetical protein
MFELLLSSGKKLAAAISAQWHSASRNVTIEGDTATFLRTVNQETGEQIQWGAAFGTTLPDQSCFFDVDLSIGHPEAVMNLGICGERWNGENWTYNQHEPLLLYWQANMIVRGLGGTSLGPDNLRAGIHRFAINKENQRLYMQRISPNPTEIVSVSISPLYDVGSRIRPFAMSEWNNSSLPVKLLKVESGSGGLY